MANNKIKTPFKRISATGLYEVGDATDNAIVSTVSLYLKPSTSPALDGGAITIRKRPKGKPAEDAGITGFLAPYAKEFLNGAVGDESFVSTVITGESAIVIPSTGWVVVLDVAAIVAGSWDVYITRAEGSG